MKKALISLVALCTYTTGTPASPPFETVDEMKVSHSINITVKDKTAHITGAQGMVLKIYNLTGTCTASFHIDSQDSTISLNLPKGCYILKIDQTVRKISLP